MTTSFTDTPTTALSNPTIDVLMSHCTVRRLSEQPLSDDQITTLLDVAKRAPTSSYRQQFSIIRITDPAIREALREISTQPYVGGTRGELVIFVADLHRNARIREAAGQDTEILSSANLFLAATEDALIAAHNMMVAAESMGLGTVYLGSFLRKPQEVIDLLGLPPLTFPIVGLLMGYPEAGALYRPRVPHSISVGENAYPSEDTFEQDLAEYDQEVQEYYNSRRNDGKVFTFTNLIQTGMGMPDSFDTSPVLETLHRQGLALH